MTKDNVPDPTTTQGGVRSKLADPLVNGFDARQFADSTLDIKGSGAEFVASHGLKETLFQLMRHEIQGACLVGAVMDAVEADENKLSKLELDYKIAKTSIRGLSRRATEAEEAQKKAWEEYTKVEAEMKRAQDTEKKAIDSLRAAERTIKQLTAESRAKDDSLA